MQISNIEVKNTNYTSKCNFKSVYPVYHWHRVNGKFVPATDSNVVHRYQKLLAGILRQGGFLDLEHGGKSFLYQIASFVAQFDSDYKYGRYVRSFYDNHGGYKYDSKGEAYKIVPSAYLLTGKDAIEFEETFGRPIGKLKNEEELTEKELDRAVKRAKVAFATKGYRFVKERCGKLKDKDTQKPLELHTIFVQWNKHKKPELIKLGFFQQGDENNPLIKNNII